MVSGVSHLTSSVFRNILEIDLDGVEADGQWCLKDLSDKGSIVVANLKEGL